MTDSAAIEFHDVGKSFRRASHAGVKDLFTGAFRRDRSRGGGAGSGAGRMHAPALSGLSLRVEPGEAVAMVGRNGSGKSTALALAAGVYQPTTGRVTTRGRISPLLALGAGVHPDLTGRENVELNGVLLGLTRRQVRHRFEAILEFSELGSYIDEPVRHYSSGMLARLGFSVATHLDPQVLLIDEVLAVGDAAFQQKCHERILDFRGRGITMLYVSHDVHSVLQLCDHAVYLSGGVVQAQGDTREVCASYYKDQGLELG